MFTAIVDKNPEQSIRETRFERVPQKAADNQLSPSRFTTKEKTMRLSLFFKRPFLGLAIACCLTATAHADLTTNGGFELGDTSGWTSFPSANSTFEVTTDSSSGSFAGEVFNDDLASAAIIKQANLGIGDVTTDEIIYISFDAKGAGAVGGVVFAEFFSEIDGGGVSKGEILGGGPLTLTSEYQTFSFEATTGADVSGGVTLQFAVVTGGAAGSNSRLFLDNVVVAQAVPEPGSMALLALGGLALVSRRRK